MDRDSQEAALDHLTEALEFLDRARLGPSNDVARLRRSWQATDVAIGLVTDLLMAWDD